MLDAAEPLSAAEIVGLVPMLRDFVRRLCPGVSEVDDVVQETVTRLLANRWRLESATALGYAQATARHLVLSDQREDDIGRRHRHRLIQLLPPPTPEEVAARRAEYDALAQAFGRLSAPERELLLSHTVQGHPVATLAATAHRSPAALRVALHRARARLRLEYLLSLRGVKLPADRCRSVLIAVSLGDRGRQRALGAGRHLAACATCAALIEALTARRRPVAALLPFGLLVRPWRWLTSACRQHKSASVSAGAVAAMALVAALVLELAGPSSAGGPRTVASHRALPRSRTSAVHRRPPVAPRRPAEPASTVQVGQVNLLSPAFRGALLRYSGQRVTGVSVPVASEPSAVGMWVGGGPWRLLWVSFLGKPPELRPGQLVDFTATIVRSDSDYAEDIGLTGSAARTLTQEEVHILAPAGAIRVVAGS